MPELIGEDTISEELERACAEEPIHVIGTVQPHGFLLVVDIATTRIVQVSSGTARHWRGLKQAAELLDTDLATCVDGLGADAGAALAALPYDDPVALTLRPRLFEYGIASGTGSALDEQFECVGHRVGELAVLEWQPQGDAPDAMSGEGRGMVKITSSLLRLRSARALEAFYRDCVREVAQLSGFDRVMLYRFLPDWSGEVIAEQAVGSLKTRFLGLRFPASDIPSQARALYAESKIRVLADVLAVSDTLLPPQLPNGVPLDQSHTLLRGFSEVHQTYLKNMGVRATLSLSLVCEGKLWGLIACHHYEPRVPPHHVRETLRQVCEVVAGVCAMRIETLSQLAIAHNAVALDQLLVRVHHSVLKDEDIQAALERLVPELLAAFDADAFCVRIGELSFVGGSSHSQESATAITQEVASRFGTAARSDAGLLLSDLLTPDGTALASLPAAAGLMAAQQSGDTLDFCAFTRPEILKQVDWAGAPIKHIAAAPDGRVRLEPRRSFELWKQDIGGTARAWSPTEADACERLLHILSDAYKRAQHKSLERQLRWYAQHDHLTGLVNRRSVEQSLEQRLTAKRYDLALLLIDLDQFKMVNDTHGHAAGDRLLKTLAERLQSVVQPNDILARVGGDEFLLIAQMPLPDPAQVLAIAARLHAAVKQTFDVEGQAVGFSLSVGIAIPPGHGTNATDLMRRADLALYSAKKSGQESTVIFDAKLEQGLLGSYELERDLQAAIGKGELSLAFQPEVDLKTGRVVGLEALLRWTHATRGAIGPDVFIPLAERSNLIRQIGQWVVRTAIATQAEWRLRGLTSPPVAVNVSMTEVISGSLVATIAQLLTEFQMPPSCLSVELTESVIMKDPRLALSVLNELKQLGIATALDDFGTGYSSLSRLRHLPLTCLKVDRSFTADLTQDAHSRSLTQAIIRMAEALKMSTIAEGIETDGQLQWLRTHNCTTGQGYLFSPAVPQQLVHATSERIEAAWRASH